jgi:hypothetical protein
MNAPFGMPAGRAGEDPTRPGRLAAPSYKGTDAQAPGAFPHSLIVEVACHPDGRETATARWAGLDHSATSRNGAVLALCRVLVKAGCPEETRWEVPGRISGTVGGTARLTIVGGDQPLRFVKWRPGPNGEA